jgi:sterol desaturase/sphingolipid hydroxylase (fatty acid hydroxylase superfamily)
MGKPLTFDGKTYLGRGPMPEDLYRDGVIKGMTMGNPGLVFVLYVPLALAYAGLALFRFGVPWPAFLGLAAAGVAWWTLFEYVTHRFAFHWQPEGRWARRVLYVMHHGHHQYPNDERLMVSNPWVSLPASAVFLGLAWLLMGGYGFAFLAGMLAAYLTYDWLHHAVHTRNYKVPLFQALKKHHMRHHYRDPEANYGFTTTFWDRVFGTRDPGGPAGGSTK